MKFYCSIKYLYYYCMLNYSYILLLYVKSVGYFFYFMVLCM